MYKFLIFTLKLSEREMQFFSSDTNSPFSQAHDEPDVYETSDLPESDQSTDFFEEENDPIERIHLSTDEAFNKFKGKYLDSENVDFSTRLAKRSRTGYDARSWEWELVGSGENETLIQRYNRLLCEMKEVLEEVNKFKNVKKDEGDNCLLSSQKIEQALKQLADLKLEDTLGEEIMQKISDPQGAQLKYVTSMYWLLKKKNRKQIYT